MSGREQNDTTYAWLWAITMVMVLVVTSAFIEEANDLERELEAARDSIAVLTAKPDPCPETGRFTTPNGGTMIITLCTGEEDDTATTDRIPDADPH
jgi:hypothetical protein